MSSAVRGIRPKSYRDTDAVPCGLVPTGVQHPGPDPRVRRAGPHARRHPGGGGRRPPAQKQAEADAVGKTRRNVGIQTGLNEIFRERLTGLPEPWKAEVPVFEPDEASGKGFWTMDFRKSFTGLPNGVGVEATFNHAEALAWTLIRPTLAYQSEAVLPGSRIDVAAVLIGTDQLKRGPEGNRMDSRSGSTERLRTLLPKMKWVLPAPIVIFGIEWGDGPQIGDVEEIDLYTLSSGLKPVEQDRIQLADFEPKQSRGP